MHGFLRPRVAVNGGSWLTRAGRGDTARGGGLRLHEQILYPCELLGSEVCEGGLGFHGILEDSLLVGHSRGHVFEISLKLFREGGREFWRSRGRARKRGHRGGGDVVDGDSRVHASKYVAALSRHTLFAFDGIMGAARLRLPPVPVLFVEGIAIPVRSQLG